MSSKGAAGLFATVLLLFAVFAWMPMIDNADAAAPTYSSIYFDPSEPSFEDDINVSVTFSVDDETITLIKMQVCHQPLGESGGLCEPPVDMTDSGDGETFFATVPGGGFGRDADALLYTFHFTVFHGSGNQFTYPSNPDSHELNVTVVKKASMIMVDAQPDRTTIYPNETISVSGKVTDDLYNNVSGAQVNLTVVGEGIENSTTTDPFGDFDISLLIPSDGNYTLNLSVEKDGMKAYDQWDVTVNTWPIPQILLEGGIWLDGESVIPSDPYEFYTGENVSITFEATNAGTGTAYNLTVIFNITGMEDIEVRDANLTPDVGFGGWIPFNTSTPGDHTVTITVEYDQEAPEKYRQPHDPVVINISIRDPPTWEDHTVLLEMFTQTTCGPCVYVEEALERLYEDAPIDFNFITYVFDDQPSQEKAEDMGVTSTPDLFVDHTFDRMTGGDRSSFLSGDIRSDMVSMIENASARDTPPTEILITEEDDSVNITLELGSVYTEDISGILQVQLVETHSNMRNLVGIPIAHRFLETSLTQPVSDLSPGQRMNFSVPSLSEGEGIVVVLYDDEGMVLQSSSHLPGDALDLFMEEDSELLRTDSPGEELVNITIERFQFDDSSFDDISYSISAPDLPEGWNLYLGENLITSDGYRLDFTFSDSESEELSTTRVRFRENLSLFLVIPEGANGTESFHIEVNSSGHIYTHTVAVIATPREGPGPVEDPSIDNVYLQEDGDILHIYVEASNVPEDATIKARILPCDYGENAACGLPLDHTLEMYESGIYRADASDVDLKNFTHLTYNAWIEKDGTKLVESGEEQVEISQLIGPAGDDDDDGEDGDQDNNTTLFIAIAAVAVLIVIIVMVLLLISRKKKENLSTEEE